MVSVVALFGEAEKGSFSTPHFCRTLPQLAETLGEPPEASEGLFFAIQALLYERSIIYFRVQEEGLSVQDYLQGLKYLSDPEKIKDLHALCLPGVGHATILEATQLVCSLHHSLVLVTQRDLYDYLTS